MNKIFVAGVTCILLTITILPATPYQASMTNNFHIEKRDILTNGGGNILYVGGDGPENYSKIQNAIDNASDGDTVFVYDDSSPYYENIVINKSINLVGENKDTTVIDGMKKGHVIKIYGNKINLTGFTVRNSSKWPACGIYLSSNSLVNVFNNTINSNGLAIRTYHSHNITISWNMILDSGAGIDISYSDNNVISHNYVLNKGFGICIGGSNNNNVSFNTLYKNSMGIGIENGFNNKVYKNSISFCKGNGISIYSGSGNLIVGNTVAQNQIGIQSGISTLKLVSPCTLNVITKNNLINNQRDAFVICHYIPLPNFWIHNYWNSWRLPIPRPIPGVIEGFFGLLLFFPWVQFDWMPRLFPYGGEE